MPCCRLWMDQQCSEFVQQAAPGFPAIPGRGRLTDVLGYKFVWKKRMEGR